MKKFVAIMLTIILLYVSIIFLVPLWGTNSEEQPGEKKFYVNVLTSGGYSSLYLYASEPFDWTKIFPPTSDRKRYITFTWSTTKEVRDHYGQFWLSPFGLAEGMLIVSYTNSIQSYFFTSARYKINNDHYTKMQRYIINSVVMENNAPVLNQTKYPSNNRARYYQVHTRPNLFYSGNTWLNGALKAAGIKTAHWTLLPFGIFYHDNEK